MSERPFINAHSHVFNAKHVPPYLAKKFLPLGLWLFFDLRLIVGIYKLVRSIKKLKYHLLTVRLKRFFYQIAAIVKRNIVFNSIVTVLKYWFIFIGLTYLIDWFAAITSVTFSENNVIINAIDSIKEFLKTYSLYPENLSTGIKVLLVSFVLLFFKSGRNLIFFILKKLFAFFNLIPGKQTRELLKRYLMIAKYTVYGSQTNIFKKMKDQYPPKSGFVLLSMDMAYMKSGKVTENFDTQLQGLLTIKNASFVKKQDLKVYPFLFIDPRRVENKPNKNYLYKHLTKLHKENNAKPLFRYTAKENHVEIEDCMVKTYMEDHQFSGFKIYPALGYYPFDKELLAVWKYAEQHNIPIMSHCIKGTIFYRGNKKKEWGTHPVFKEENKGLPLLLPEAKNVDFQLDFTHPMNYLCLLEEMLLRELIHQYKDEKLNTLFGYSDLNTPLKYPFTKLKICLAHYGGKEHWEKYLEKDSYNYSNQIMKNPGVGIKLFDKNKNGTTSSVNFNRLAQLWKYVDWYSIISTMMMQYENVYADISYILHNPSIFPLLKETLDIKNEKLPKRVLFGTDFYVVRNHNSEKDLYASSSTSLSKAEFDLISKLNPQEYLTNNFPK